jgi:hypothetical protein
MTLKFCRLFFRRIAAVLILASLATPLHPNSDADSASHTSGIYSGNGVPGTTQTDSGYDTEMGVDPMCWTSSGDITNVSYSGSGNETLGLSNYLIKNFDLSANSSVELLRACPGNGANYIQGRAPPEKLRGERLRTGTWYNYSVDVKLDLSALGGTEFVADDDNVTIHRVSVQILLCRLGMSGFCSPFIHDEGNFRLWQEGNTSSVPTGATHGGSHIHSPRVFIRLDPRNTSHAFSTEVPMLANVPGDYFAIAAVQMFVRMNHTNENSTSDNTNATLVRYDMSNKLDNFSLLTYQDPPNVLKVPPAVVYLSYIGIAVAGAIIAFLLLQTLKHRNNKVLQLTQGPFLIVFLAAALVATLGALLLNPVSDGYCQAGFPTVLISLQLVFAVTFGRLWRINAVISPLLMRTLRREQGWKKKLFGKIIRLFSRSTNSRDVKLLRRKVTNSSLAAMVAALTLPQVVLQVLAIVLQPSTLSIAWNEDESIGSVWCQRQEAKYSLTYYGCYMFFLLVVSLLLLAHATRMLPSLLSETRLIFDSTLSSLVVLFLGIGVIAVTRDPTTSPGVEYLVSTICILSLTLNMSWRIVMPKLRMVWRGETILVSKLVSDHTRSVRQEDDRVRISGLVNPLESVTATGTASGVTALNDTATSRALRHTKSSGHSDSVALAVDLERFDSDLRLQGSSRADGLQWNTESTISETDGPVHGGAGAAPPLSSLPGTAVPTSSREVMLRAAQQLSSQRLLAANAAANSIIVTSHQTPARRLVLRMVDLQEHLYSVNERIMSGLAVSEEDWTRLRKLCTNMGHVFADEVRFEWEPQTTELEPRQGTALNAEIDPQFARLLEEVDEDDGEDPDGEGSQERRRRVILDMTGTVEDMYVADDEDDAAERIEI